MYLNKACPKDSIPLPKIDIMVDVPTNQEIMSFLGAFSDYNQIKMNAMDEKKNFLHYRTRFLLLKGYVVQTKKC